MVRSAGYLGSPRSPSDPADSTPPPLISTARSQSLVTWSPPGLDPLPRRGARQRCLQQPAHDPNLTLHPPLQRWQFRWVLNFLNSVGYRIYAWEFKSYLFWQLDLVWLWIKVLMDLHNIQARLFFTSHYYWRYWGVSYRLIRLLLG